MLLLGVLFQSNSKIGLACTKHIIPMHSAIVRYFIKLPKHYRECLNRLQRLSAVRLYFTAATQLVFLAFHNSPQSKLGEASLALVIAELGPNKN